MATFTLRHDGSSVFTDGKRWGTFPSFSAGWVITNEKFMENTASWLDFLKLRASWGQNGNCQIGNFYYLSNIGFSPTTYADYGYKFSNDDMELTQLGWEQHQRIARTMYNRFPQVFEKGGNVLAIASLSGRCVLSMSISIIN